MDVNGKQILVVGLARSGLAVATALARRGAVVTVMDSKPPVAFRDILPQLIKAKMGMELGSQRVETFLRHEAIVVSPGVPWDLPQLQAARQQNIPVYPEVEAASWFLEGTFVGVTGSNGKTTTTSLLGDMLKASSLPTFVGGNIGNALSTAVDHAPPGTTFVTELSSFQLEGIQEFHPQVAVMLNLSPNHLDRHASMEAYGEAKRRIFRNQGVGDYAVLNADDPWVAGLGPTVASEPVFFSRRRELADGVFASGGKVYYRVGHLERVLFETRDIPLRGDFNLENVLAATTAACLLGAEFPAIRAAVRAFKGVEHRLEFVREIRGVDFYNNSKATSVDAALKSVEAFEHGVHLIMGGKDKGAPYTPLLSVITDRVRDILVIGAAAPVIAEQLAGSTDLLQAGDLSTAVYEAFARSHPGDTVLLAPACSSFDQFQDYEERGHVFKELVNKLAEDVALGALPRPQLSVVVMPQPAPIEAAAAEPSPALLEAPEAVAAPEAALESEGALADAPAAVAENSLPPDFETVSVQMVPEEPAEVAKELDDARTEQPAKSEEAPPPELASDEPPEPQMTDEVPVAPAQSVEEPAKAPADLMDAVELRPPTPVDAVAEVEIGRQKHREQNPPEALAGSPGHRVELSKPAPEAKISTAPRHCELTYVYEVDAVELPPTELPAVPEGEPDVYALAGPPEFLDDEIMLFEARPAVQRGESKIRGLGRRVRKPKPEAELPLPPPNLFNESDK